MPPDLQTVQRRFQAAMTGDDDAPLLALLASDLPPGVSAARRIAVHRNTYFASLTEALAAAHPVTEKLVGRRFFAAAARAFIAADPPPRPDLAAYGGGFGSFLDGFVPAAGVPYLGDAARLEWARVEATFAAEAEPLDPAALATVPPDAVGRLIFTFHPSARLVRSSWAVQSIWEAHQTDPPRPFDPAAGAERVLILRPGDRMLALRLSGGETALLAALLNGRPLLAAAEAGLTAEPGLDLQAALARLLTAGAVIATMAGERTTGGDRW